MTTETEPYVLISVQDDGDDYSVIEIEFPVRFEIGQSGLNLKDAIKDTISTINRMINNLETDGISDDYEKHNVQALPVNRIVVNNIDLTENELDAIYHPSKEFTVSPTLEAAE